MLEIINFYFLNKYIVEIWLIFSLLISSFILFYNSKIRLIGDSYITFNLKINYYIVIFFISILLSLWKIIYTHFNNSAEILDSLTYLDIMDWMRIFFLFICLYFYYLLKIYTKIDKKLFNVEILILLSFAMLGLFLIFKSTDFIWFYLSLELYSLSVYAFIFLFNYNSFNPSLKYFIIGSVSSLILVFSITVIYFYTGTLEMESLKLFFYGFKYLDTAHKIALLHQNFFLVFGVGLFIVSFALKLGLAPLHSWSIDVYSNQSYYSTFFLLILPKFTFITFLINFFVFIAPSLLENKLVYFIVLIFSLSSVLVGTLGVINQTNIKKIILYSSLGNVIFLLMPLINNSFEILCNYFVFSFFYFLNLMIILTILMYIKDFSSNNPMKKIDNFCSLYKSHPYLSCLLSFSLLSLSGIPPFIGFFTKFFFLQALFSTSIALFLVVLVSNCIMFFYSIKIIRFIFFNNNKKISLLTNINWKFSTFILFLSVLLNILTVVYLHPIYAFIYFIISTF